MGDLKKWGRFLALCLAACLLMEAQVQAAGIKNYKKTDFSAFSDVVKSQKKEVKNDDTDKGIVLEKAITKTFAGKKKKETMFLSKTIFSNKKSLSAESFSYVKKGKKIYARSWGTGTLKPEYISKNSRYIIAVRLADDDSGMPDKVLTYRFKKEKYQRMGSFSVTGTEANFKKILKKIRKKYKTGKLQKIKYQTIFERKEKDPEKVPATAASFDAILADLSVSLLGQIVSSEEAGKNQLISADSIATALAMAENGAAGDTLTEMTGTLSPGMDLETYCTELGNFNKRITGSQDVVMHIADSMWIKNAKDIQIKDSFLQKNKSYFGADSFLEPFDNSTVSKINQWASDNTNQMIPQIIQEIPAEAIMCLINAVAFEGEWSKQFSDNQAVGDQKFVNSDASESKVTMLSDKESAYIRLKDGVGFVRNYKGGSFAFVGLLPPAGMSNAEYLKSFTGQDLIAAVQDQKTDKDVYIKLPEFSYDYTASLNPYLQKLGVQKAFGAEADFSGMAEKSRELGIKIDSVLHKTHIELDRNGTKAAAVTAVMMAATSIVHPVEKERLEIYLDRPFVYAIIDTETGVPIFMGDVNHL